MPEDRRPTPGAPSPTAAPTPGSRSFGEFTVRTLIALGLTGALVVGALLVWTARDLVMLSFAGVLLAVVLSWPAELLATRTRMPRGLALGVVIVVLVVVIALGAFLMGNAIAQQVQQLRQTLPTAVSRVIDSAQKTHVGAFILDQTTELRKAVSDYATRPEVLGRVGGVLSSTFGVAANIALVVVLAVFLALSPSFYVGGLVSLAPPAVRARFRRVLARIGQTLRWWFFGQLCSMATIGLLTFVGLKVIGVPLALTLGCLAALLNFIPNFGPILAAIPALIIAIAPHGNGVDLNYHTALYVALLYIAVQAAEGSVITPLIQHKAVALPPALIVVFQVLLALLVGPLGLILATPVLAVVLVIVQMLYIQDVLGDGEPMAKSG